VFLAMALITGVLWLGFFSAALSAREVTVRGLHDLSADEVRAAAVVPLGRPMLRQDIDAIAARAASVPAVQSASVVRDFPNTIAITVVERRPLLAVRQPGGYLLVDKFGVGYQLKSDVPDGVSVVDANPDDRLLLADLGTVASALPAKLTARLITIRASGRDDINLVLKSGLTVHWGDSSQSELKADIVAVLLKKRPNNAIDVSSPHNPTTR
jgi:cell division protein FtsQ